MTDEKLQKLQDIINRSKNIVFFGGAGVSTESGIPDFRSTNGLYNQKYKYPPEMIISHSFLEAHPEEFFRFYRDKMLITDVLPNPAHYALAKLEKIGKLYAVVTQNIDGLHQKAGSKKVYELHGSIHRNYCADCKIRYEVSAVLESESVVPRCSHCSGIIRPDVTLYEEALDDDVTSKAIRAIANADTLIVGGTSLVVYPAAGLINYFRGKELVLINKTATSADTSASLIINDAIGEVLGNAIP
jgi:NAD-dependent deacetylase